MQQNNDGSYIMSKSDLIKMVLWITNFSLLASKYKVEDYLLVETLNEQERADIHTVVCLIAKHPELKQVIIRRIEETSNPQGE